MTSVTLHRIRGYNGRGAGRIGNMISYEILSDITRMADGFKVTFPGPIGRNPRPLLSGDEVEFRVGSSVLALGVVDATWTSISEESSLGTAIGRDMARDLVDLSMPLYHDDAIGIVLLAELVAQGTGIRGIVTQGLAVDSFVGATSIDAINSIDPTALRVHTEPGETRAQFLQRYVAFMDRLAWVNTLGQLVIGLPSKGPPIGTIRVQEGRSNASAIVRRAPALAFSEVKVLTSPETDLEMGTSDEELPIEFASVRTENPLLAESNRTLMIPVSDQISIEEATLLAQRALARSAADVLSVETATPGHSVGGRLLRPDQSWRVVIPDEGIDESLYLKAVRYMRSPDENIETRCSFVQHGAVVSDYAGPQEKKDEFDFGFDGGDEF